MTVDSSFRHAWGAQVLATRTLILPPRHFVYPRDAEGVERGAMEVMIRPAQGEPFLATCALGFRDPAVPTGIWAMPNPQEVCAVSGGYAYVIDTTVPERFSMIAYRPVMEVRAVPAAGLLLFVGHRQILAWGHNGQVWESPKLSDEGVTVREVDGEVLRGEGWNMISDKTTPFALDLRTGSLRIER